MTIILTRRLIVLAALAAATTALAAAPDRDGLIGAWEAHLRALPSTKVLEPRGEQTWFLEDTDLPYRGEIRLAGALVRPADNIGGAGDFTHMGLVELQLTDLTDAQRATQSYYYWLSDRQTLYYSESAQEWLGTAAYQQALNDLYRPSRISLGPLSFMLNYGVWFLLVGLIVFVVVLIVRQSGKARALMDDSAEINRRARENIERGAELQAELSELARQSRDLQAENNALLRELIDTLRR